MKEDKPYKDQHALSSRIYEGYVEHKRKKPKEHAFRYGLYFYCFDLDELGYLDHTLPLFGYNRIRPASIFSGNRPDFSGHVSALFELYLQPGQLLLRFEQK
jgi:DUF1365 family protein